MDRRNKSRLDVELTCYVSPLRVIARSVMAITKNVSRTGMLMRWAEDQPTPVVGRKFTVEIELPENSDFGARLMRCNATVVRVERIEGEPYSVALKIHRMKFVETAAGRTGSACSTELASMPLPTLRTM